MSANGWQTVSLGSVIERPQYGTSKKCRPDPAGSAVLRIPNVVSRRIDTADLKYAEFDETERSKYGLRENDVLIIRSNGSLSIVGKSALVRKQDEEFLYAGYLIRLRPDTSKISGPFLNLLLMSRDLRSQIESKAKSTSGVNNINSKEIQALEVPLPPLPEQRRIVARIEELFSRLDAGVAALRHAKAQLQRYRQSVLAAAVTGQLTQAWREQHPDTEWSDVCLGDLCKFSQGVQIPKRDQAEVCGPGMVRFLRIVDYTKGSEPPRYIDDPGEQYALTASDLAMIRYGSAGRICKGYAGVIANNLFRIEPDDRAVKSFLYHYFSAPQFLQVLALNIKGATMPAISFKFLKELKLKLPPLAEQHQIVAEVEARTTAIDHLEAELDRQITRSNRLRQSTLAAAFSGKL